MDMNANLKWRIGKSKMAQYFIVGLAFLCLIPLALVLFYIFKKGIGSINWHFLSSEQMSGGIWNGILGTLIIVPVSALIAIPIGIMGGIYLSEYKQQKFAIWVSTCVDIIQGIPSIVLGIIGYLWLVLPMHGQHSALSGSVALAVMMLPIIIRSTEETLKLIPDTLKEASYALGVPFQRTMWKVIVPCGFNGIISGIMLGVSRISGEAAPLLFTAFGNPFVQNNIFKEMGSLPLIIVDASRNPSPETQAQAWGTSLILLVIIFVLNILTKLLTSRWKVQL